MQPDLSLAGLGWLVAAQSHAASRRPNQAPSVERDRQPIFAAIGRTDCLLFLPFHAAHYVVMSTHGQDHTGRDHALVQRGAHIVPRP